MSNNSDIFKAMASTASVIVNNPNSSMTSSELLLQNNAYKNAIHSTLRRLETGAIINKHSRPRPRPRPNTRRQDLSGIADELLTQVPPNEEAFSLFQGFNAVLPEINEVLELIRDGKLIEDDNVSGSALLLPKGVTEEKIKSTQNPRQLTSFRDEINYRLDLLEIKKGISSNEILEIDGKIQLLQLLRQQVFDKIKKFEQDEIYLENQLYEIGSRLEIIKNVEPDEFLDDVSKEETDIEEDEEFQVIETEELESNLMSKSIYGKLKKDVKRTNRKTKPTLQTYYEPGSQISKFDAHNDSITTLDFDIPFGTLVSASIDNTVRVWDLSKSKCTGLLEGHVASVNCLQMRDNLVVTGSTDATLKIWDLTNLHSDDDNVSPLLHSLDSHVEEVTALNFHNNVLVSGSSDRTIRQWDLNTGHCIQTIDVLWAATQNSISHSQFLSSSVLDNSSNSLFIGALQVYEAALATGTADGVVRLWDLRSGEVIRQLVGHTGPVTSLQFDDKLLTTGSTDRSIRIWDLRTGSIIDAFAYESPISSLQFDSRRIVSTNNETCVKIYDRIEERHWTCESDSIPNYVRYKDSYVVSGCANGQIVSYAV